jgi:thiol:disulfide interchange protein DsbD
MKTFGWMAKGVAAVVLLAGARSLVASDPVPIHWMVTATTAALPLGKGSKVVATVTATIAPGWHLYAFEQQPGGPLPTNLSLVADQFFVADGSVGESAPKTEYDPNFQLPTSLFEDRAVFTVPAKAVGGRSYAGAKIKIDVAFQTCNDRMCLPLTVVHLTAPIVARRAK